MSRTNAASSYAVRAAERSWEVHAYEEAGHWYGRALEALRPGDPREGDLLLHCGEARLAAGDLSGARAAYERAAALARTRRRRGTAGSGRPGAGRRAGWLRGPAARSAAGRSAGGSPGGARTRTVRDAGLGAGPAVGGAVVDGRRVAAAVAQRGGGRGGPGESATGGRSATRWPPTATPRPARTGATTGSPRRRRSSGWAPRPATASSSCSACGCGSSPCWRSVTSERPIVAVGAVRADRRAAAPTAVPLVRAVVAGDARADARRAGPRPRSYCADAEQIGAQAASGNAVALTFTQWWVRQRYEGHQAEAGSAMADLLSQVSAAPRFTAGPRAVIAALTGDHGYGARAARRVAGFGMPDRTRDSEWLPESAQLAQVAVAAGAHDAADRLYATCVRTRTGSASRASGRRSPDPSPGIWRCWRRSWAGPRKPRRTRRRLEQRTPGSG